MVVSSETLIFTAGVGYDEGAGQILSLPAGSTTPVPLTGGISVQQPEFVVGGGFIFASDKWCFERLGGTGQASATMMPSATASTGFTADETSVYWATEPEGVILAANHDGTHLRLLANAGGRPIALQIDGTNLFWIDEPSRLRSVPLTGGAVTDVIAEAGGISSFLLDGQFVYAALQDVGLLVKVSKTGESAAVLAGIPAFQKTALAQTGGTVLWSAGSSIWSIPKAGGSAQVVAQGLSTTPAALATDGVSVFWLEPTADRIRATALPK